MLSSPSRAPKLQHAAEQPLTGECWIPPKKIPHIQGQRRSPNKTEGGAKSCLESNPIPARHAQRAQTNLVCTRPHRDWTSLGSLKESWCLGSTDSDSALSGYGFSIELMKSLPGGSDVMPGLRTTHLSKYSLVPSFLCAIDLAKV